MKTLKYFSIVLLALISFNFANAQSPTKVKATFNGFNDLYEYVFISEQGDELVFQEMDYDINITLDDDAVGNKYELSYVEETVDEIDEDGNPTGSTYKIKKITTLKQL